MLRCLSTDGGSAIRVIDESGLTFTQMKVLMTLAGAARAGPVPEAGSRGARALAAVREPGRRRAGQAVARRSHGGSRRSPPASAGPDRRRPGARRPDHARAAGGARAVRRLARRRGAAAPHRGAGPAARPRGDRGRSTASTEGTPTDDPIQPPDHRRQLQVVDARRDVLRPVHDHARQHGGQRRPAVDPGRPRLEPLEPRVDDQRLHAQLRRPARHRRAPRRHLRPPPGVPRRRDDLRRLLGRRRASPPAPRRSWRAASSRASARR